MKNLEPSYDLTCARNNKKHYISYYTCGDWLEHRCELLPTWLTSTDRIITNFIHYQLETK